MNKLTVTLALALTTTACATGRTIVADDHNAGPHARVQLQLQGSPDTMSVFPSALDAAVPSVDRIGREVRGTLGDRATAQIDLCVSPAGRVTKVALVEGSTFGEFDTALVRDIEGWRFEAMPGPSTLQTCERAMITYHPY